MRFRGVLPSGMRNTIHHPHILYGAIIMSSTDHIANYHMDRIHEWATSRKLIWRARPVRETDISYKNPLLDGLSYRWFNARVMHLHCQRTCDKTFGHWYELTTTIWVLKTQTCFSCSIDTHQWRCFPWKQDFSLGVIYNINDVKSTQVFPWLISSKELTGSDYKPMNWFWIIMTPAFDERY